MSGGPGYTASVRMKQSQTKQRIIGVDEVGRGPLAGPVMVGVVMVPKDFDWNLVPGVGDSKQVTEAKREQVFTAAKRLKQQGIIGYEVASVSAKRIDRIGIAPAIREALTKALTTMLARAMVDPASVSVKLDGGLRAPEEFLDQETIIKGDAREKVIGLASIVAKVTRDRYMVRIGKGTACAAYDFATHKGYGTKSHRAAILTHGLSPFHRASFCRNLLTTSRPGLK